MNINTEKKFLNKIKWQRLKLDLELSILLIALLGVGTSFIFSASYNVALKDFNDSRYFFDKQLLNLALGTVAMLIVSKIRYQSLRGYIPVLNVITFVFMLMIYVPALSVTVNGATRWISLFGITFQPSEVAKITIILTLGHILDKKRRLGQLNNLKEGILPIAMYCALLVGFVIMQKHLSASGVLIFIAGSMIILAGIKKIYLGIGALAGVAFAVIAVILEPFRLKRFFNFLDPYADPLGAGHQIIQSWWAFGGGGLKGLGLGMGRQKFDWLPEAHTDFILAIIGEEMGFIGIMVVFALFLWFLLRGLMIAMNAKDFYGTVVAFGIVAMLFFQVAINVSVVSGMFPVTGMPLPFISYGGTSVIMLMMAIGILFNIASQTKEKQEKM